MGLGAGSKLVERLPRCALILGYGSGVITQSGYSSLSKTQIDLIVVVSNRDEFLLELERRMIITKCNRVACSLIQPEVCFFSDVELDSDKLYKIGVVEAGNFLRKLCDWDSSFYVPGRLQKPVKILYCESRNFEHRVQVALESNRRSALAAALLMFPDEQRHKFDVTSLFSSLVRLSYLGDIRMNFAENPKKVQNIVSAQSRLLLNLYEPHFEKVGIVRASSGGLICHKSPSGLWNDLPINFRRHAIQLADPQKALEATLSRINARESAYQAFAGLGTSGLTNSFRYLVRKVSKRFR